MRNAVITLAFLGAVIVAVTAGFFAGRFYTDSIENTAQHYSQSLPKESVDLLADFDLTTEEEEILNGFMLASLNLGVENSSGVSGKMLLAAHDEYMDRCAHIYNDTISFCKGFNVIERYANNIRRDEKRRENLRIMREGSKVLTSL